VCVALPVVLLRAAVVGTDFGLNHAPDVHGEADQGALIVFAVLMLVWLGLA
jgi:hypothetical protein